jgi:putative transposase
MLARTPRLARIVVPGRAHHVTQRGNRREAIFFEDGDQAIYMDLLAEQARKHEAHVWAYWLMPNHVHLVVVPAHGEALGLAIGEAHRRYTNFINACGRWTGHLFQSRFASVVLDDDHFVPAVRYVSLNPVRIPHFRGLLEASVSDDFTELRRAEATGRPLGTDDFVKQLEHLLDRPIARRAPGRKPNSETQSNRQFNLL